MVNDSSSFAVINSGSDNSDVTSDFDFRRYRGLGDGGLCYAFVLTGVVVIRVVNKEAIESPRSSLKKKRLVLCLKILFFLGGGGGIKSGPLSH